MAAGIEDQSQLPLTCQPGLSADDFYNSGEHIGMAVEESRSSVKSIQTNFQAFNIGNRTCVERRDALQILSLTDNSGKGGEETSSKLMLGAVVKEPLRRLKSQIKGLHCRKDLEDPGRVLLHFDSLGTSVAY